MTETITLETFPAYVHDQVLSIQAYYLGNDKEKMPEKVYDHFVNIEAMAIVIMNDKAMAEESTAPDRFDLSSLRVDLNRELPEGG